MAPDNNVKKNRPDLAERIWDFFTSLKLVIFLLLILSVLSIAGTIIEQNKPLRDYYRYFSPDTVAFLNKLGLFDMYHSWWFITCLALLALNIIACTMDRYSPILSGMRKKNLVLDEALGKTMSNTLTTMKYALPLDTVENAVRERVGKTFGGKPVVTVAENGSKHYFFEKGKYSRLAFFVTHLSLLVIFAGALIGSFFGYKGYVNVLEGETVSRVQIGTGRAKDLSFQVRCNSFQVEFYPNGMPKDYRSDLSIIQGGREVIRKTIRVNDPLTFQGTSFYQSSYGTLPDRALIEVVGKDGALKGTLTTPFGEKVDLPGMPDKVEVADYRQQLQMPGGFSAGPALGVNIYPEKGQPSGRWLLMNNPDYDRVGNREYFLRAKDVKLKNYTGLQVKQDPGVWLVWLGCTMLIAGIMAAFFMSHKKLWISLRKDKKGRTELTICGTANKNRSVYLRETENIIQSLKEVS